jgi:uncharacterized protein (TIGR00297 family)
MTLPDSAVWALATTAVCAVAARLVGALTTDGAVAGAVVGACVSLGTFFVVGTVATRIGWAKKKARGTAEAGEGRRDWKRVLGKGGVAAVVALAFALRVLPATPYPGAMFAGAVSAALADTLGTEIGVLSAGRCLTVPRFQAVPGGTPGAMSGLGSVATVFGGALVALVAWSVAMLKWPENAYCAAAAGPAASACESIAVGLGFRAPGFVRNVLATTIGAVVGGLYWQVR